MSSLCCAYKAKAISSKAKLSELLLQNSSAGQGESLSRALRLWTASSAGWGAVIWVGDWLSRYLELFVLLFLSLMCQTNS